MTKCEDCIYYKNSKKANRKCEYCMNYCNYKSVNKIRFLTVIFSIYGSMIFSFILIWNI